MDRETVESSMVKSVGYSPTELTLEVEFAGGSVYQYAGVPSHIHDELMSSDSVGKSFGTLIKSQGYEYKKI